MSKTNDIWPIPFAFNGEAPDLAGRVCQEFLCETFAPEGEVEETAVVTHLRFEGNWHRLYFEGATCFWRRNDADPLAWARADAEWGRGLIDVAEEAEVRGVELSGYEVEHGRADQWRVIFEFETGQQIVILHEEDRTDVVVN